MAITLSLCFAAISVWLAFYRTTATAQNSTVFGDSFSGVNSTTKPAVLPPQAVVCILRLTACTHFELTWLYSLNQFINPQSFAVLGENGPFRQSAITQFFNPTNTKPPFFQVFHPDFVTKVLGTSASIRVIASNPGFAFAHEAPIWVPETDDIFFASNDGGALGFSDLNHNNRVSMISLGEVAKAADASESKTSPLNVTVTLVSLMILDLNPRLIIIAKLDLPETVQMTNGGTGPFHGQLLLVNSGRGPLPSNVVLVNPFPPHNTTVLLDNFFGRQFNSLNDVKIHRQSGMIYFTDSVYVPLRVNSAYFTSDT